MAEFKKMCTALAFTIGLTASGCAGLSRTAITTSSLIGQWRQTALGSGNQSKPCPAQISTSSGGAITCGQHDTVEFKTDGTFVAKFSGEAIQADGTWRVQDSTLLVTFTAPPQVAGINHSTTVEFTEDGQSMTINAITGGTPTVQTYVRE